MGVVEDVMTFVHELISCS